MTCEEVKQWLPGYLDGALPMGGRSETRARIGRHLEACEECRDELQAYLALTSLMSQVERPAPPADLALRIRVAASQRLDERPWLHYALRLRNRAELVLKNFLEPLAIPATGGFTVAFIVFVLVCQVLGIGVPLRAGSNDSPTNLLQPARLESLAAIPLTGMEESGHTGPHALLVEATINAQGEAVNYRILSGPDSYSIRRQLDMVFL
ncbi:MAG: anti-sigma factor family protein, partial [Candidatus Acidiferrales bacterium]